MKIEYKFLENYPEERFRELMDKNLHEQTVFFDLRETYNDSGFKHLNESHKIKIGAFHDNKLIGLSCGHAKSKNEFLMMISLVEKEYRNQGIYSKMLDQILEKTSSYDIIESHHHVFNNQIIRLKLNKDFHISGFNTSLFVGPTVILRRYNNEKIKEVFKYRVGVTSKKPVI